MDLDTGVELTNSTLDWKSSEGHEWILTNGLDVVTTDSSANMPVLLAIDLKLVPVPTNCWDTVTAADVVQNWTLMEQLPRQEHIFGAAPGRSNNFFFQTREGGRGMLEILGFTDNPPGVKIRYKLVQNSSTSSVAESETGPSTTADHDRMKQLAAEQPTLQFLAWQDAWKTNQLGAARHPDGSAVTNAQELAWLRNISPLVWDVSQLNLEPEPRILHLWFSHPLFGADSSAEILLLDDRGKVIPRGANGSAMSKTTGATQQNGNRGWFVTSLCPDSATNRPSDINMQLRYVIGPLENIQELSVAPKHSVSMTLDGGSVLNGMGQNVDGRAFVSIAANTDKLGSRQFGVVAVTKDGRELTRAGGSSGGGNGIGIRAEEFEFDIPFADVAKFIIGTRPIRTKEWKNVVLPDN